MTQAFNFIYTSDDNDTELLSSLQKHLAMVEEQWSPLSEKPLGFQSRNKMSTGLSQVTFKEKLG